MNHKQKSTALTFALPFVLMAIRHTLSLCINEETDYTNNYATNGNFQIPYLGPNSYRQIGVLQGWTSAAIEQGTGSIYNYRWGPNTQVIQNGDFQELKVHQDIYLISSYAARQGVSLDSNGLYVWWNGVLIRSIPFSLDYEIHTQSYFVLANQGQNQLVLEAAGVQDTVGMTCDDVQFYKVNSFNRVQQNGQCVCQFGYFDDFMNYKCISCSSLQQECTSCSSVRTNLTNSTLLYQFQCKSCLNGYFPLGGGCAPCSYYMPGCNNCTSDGLVCDSCENNADFFTNPQFNLSLINVSVYNHSNMSNSSIFILTQYYYYCKHCELEGCLDCVSLEQCLICNNSGNYFINSTVNLCQPCQLQGCARCESLIKCTICQINRSYYFQNSTSQVCSYCDPAINKFLNLTNLQCQNCIPNNCTKCLNLTHCQVCLVGLFLLNQTTLLCEPCPIEGCLSCRSFKICQICDNDNLYHLDKDGTCLKCVLCSCRSGGLIQSNVVPKIIYQEQECSNKQDIKTIFKVVIYSSYAIMFLSLISIKIVGLQLFGVLQLAFFNLADNQYVNLYLSPLLDWKFLNGFNLDIFATFNVPQSVQAINYSSLFISNINIMFLVLLAQLLVSLVLVLVSRKIKSVQKVSKFLLYQVFLTLFLFNSFNIAFSAGVQFKYASKESDYFILSTVCAGIGILLYILSIYLLQTAGQKHFGQYKGKFKNNCINKFYIPISVFYRMALGVYMALSNQQIYGTLIILSFSLAYIMYNITNLPFLDTYQNYRANLCHLTQFAILLVTNYYRSMTLYKQIQIKGKIFYPAQVQIFLIICCVFVSALCLIYQIWLGVRKCWKNKIIKDQKTQKEREGSLKMRKYNHIRKRKNNPKYTYDSSCRNNSFGNILRTDATSLQNSSNQQDQIIYWVQ